MGQREVINHLKLNPNNWVSVDELSEVTGRNVSSTRHAVRVLVQAGEITRRYDRVDNPEKPGHKRIITWVKLSDSYLHYLAEEGML